MDTPRSPGPLVTRRRREALASRMAGAGLVLMVGHSDVGINYAANAYPFWQDASFLYFFGLRRPSLVGLIDLDTGEDVLFGDDPHPHECIWSPLGPPIRDEARQQGIASCQPLERLPDAIERALRKGRVVHYLPPYRADTVLRLQALLGLAAPEVAAGASTSLIQAVIAMREIKTADEIDEIESALRITAAMHASAMRHVRPGVAAAEVLGAIDSVVAHAGTCAAYAPIFTARGGILHDVPHHGPLPAGALIVNDSGACSPGGYASDITRTLPVDGRFVGLQRDIYALVLAAQTRAKQAIAPGVRFRDVHDLAARVIAEGMKELGFLRGDVDEIVGCGAYALCFPHGLGHQMGLDVHDMESLGEDRVGYGPGERRSELFGPRFLRLAKALRAGMVLTVEPGIYFNSSLIDAWQAERRFEHLIDYAAFARNAGFGGVRIEDDVVVTEGGCRTLEPLIPSAIADVEAAMS
ncbi:aminopeptidase P family protein [Caldimonas sp. KR1-144]|uniref:aminopeptidase P family protein n=1 Tax=Caldimonas sp. KR1-144 TaxID=3400911 RepID=UPI003BFCE677